MNYIITCSICVLTLLYLNELTFPIFSIVYSNPSYKYLIDFTIIIASIILTIIYYKIFSSYEKSNSKIINFVGKYGSGKTFQVLNSDPNIFKKEDESEENVIFLNRIRNKKQLEKEFHDSCKQKKKDTLYFSALGKLETELLIEINYELSSALSKGLYNFLYYFNIKIVRPDKIFSKLNSNNKKKSINYIIIDDIERLSDKDHDIEVNKIIRLILELSKRYSVIVITSIETSINTTIESMGASSMFDKLEVNTKKSENFQHMFSKIPFDNVIAVRCSREKFDAIIGEFSAKIRERIDEVNHKYPGLHIEESKKKVYNIDYEVDLRVSKTAFQNLYNEICLLDDFDLIKLLLMGSFYKYQTSILNKFNIIKGKTIATENVFREIDEEINDYKKKREDYSANNAIIEKIIALES